MWRTATSSDDEAIVRMCLALYEEDPGPEPISAENMRRTLGALRETPLRGRVVVLERDDRPCGYALLVSFWSNELGGLIDVIDEIYVDPAQRGQRYAATLIDALANRTGPCASNIVALSLEVTPANVRARRLYERLGFQARNVAMRRVLGG